MTADTVSWITAHRFGAAAILLVDPDDRGSIAATATRLIAAISRTMVVDGRPVRIGASIGVAAYPDDGSDEDELTFKADSALSTN
ncbi:MAG: diguanylate cyclase [Mycobacterium sp.]|nr:diguanylate cyclase [Mycobacterium sp.]